MTISSGAVLFARRRAHGADDAAPYAQIGEVLKAHAAAAEVGDGAVEADHPLLHQIFGISPFQKEGTGDAAHGIFIPPQQLFGGSRITALRRGCQRLVGKFAHRRCLTAS